MERSSKSIPPNRFLRQLRLFIAMDDFHRDEDGKLTLVATIMMLAMIVLIGLIGNAGHAVNQKIEAQNAADAAAFSSALWMARGMNALTATNHMLGEATAMCAIHEGLGGPGLDLGIRENTDENRQLDAIITGTKTTAPIGPAPFVPPNLTSIDKRIIDFVTRRTTPPGDKRFKAYATIYDSKMTLKRELNIHLIAKNIADIGFFMPWPINIATVPAAYATHIYSSAQIVLIGKEWLVLDVIEKVAEAIHQMQIKQVIEQQLIPTLTAHADFVASYDSESASFEAGIVNNAVERTILELQDRHDTEMAVFPTPEQLRLPVEVEPAPNLNGGPDLPEWGDDEAILPDLSFIRDLFDRQEKAMRDLQKQIEDIDDELEDLDEYEAEIDERLELDDIPTEERAELQAEKSAIEQTRRELQKTRADNLDAQRKIREESDKLPGPDDAPANSPNPSIKRIPDEMSQSQERYSQWMRASYPYTDSFRAPILSMFERHLRKSKAAEHYRKWTDRYTMVKAWQFRSGYRLTASGNSASWSQQEDPLHMFVMRDAFDGEQSRKGNEPWTESSDDGKQQAEEYFTLIAFAHRAFQPLFTRVVYPAASDKGITTYAQAIFYNANAQRAASGSEQQQKVGWDTLNWDPASDVPEWAATPTRTNAKWPWEIFSSGDHQVKVKLNWQPKLMPVTLSRLEQSDEDLSGEMADNVEHAIEYFDDRGTH